MKLCYGYCLGLHQSPGGSRHHGHLLADLRVHHRNRFDRFCFSVMVNRNNAAVVSWESERHKTVTLRGPGRFKTSWPPPGRVNPIAINNDWFKAEKLLPTHHAVDFSLRVHHRNRFDRFCFSVMVNRNNAAVVSWESERHKTVTLRGLSYGSKIRFLHEVGSETKSRKQNEAKPDK
ncbi:hypothetical protein YC2023_030027 [Brassica napus]